MRTTNNRCPKQKKLWWLLTGLGINLLLANSPVCALEPPTRAETALTLEETIELALVNDPWLVGNEFQQQSLDAQRVAAGALPDPMISLGVANLPIDTFDFNRHEMTQLKIGVTQQFPRGDSRSLRQERLAILSSQHPLQRLDRRARVAAAAGQLWLDAYRAQESIRLIEQDRELFEYLVDVAQSSYSSALGRTRQQDLVRAQLELTRLEDRLTALHEQREIALARLNEWLGNDFSRQNQQADHEAKNKTTYTLAKVLPTVALTYPELYETKTRLSPQALFPYLLTHPAILNLDRKISASRVGIELAEQKYKPQWGVNASYGYRDDNPMGNDRADFFSVGVTFDLPIFTTNRQDKEKQAAIADSEAVKTEKWLALRNMLASFEAARARLLRLDQRRSLYRSRLLEEMHEQAEASLTAYTNDDGDFAEVVRARIAELNARIDALDIDIDRLKTVLQLNYFLTGAEASRGAPGESP